MTNILATKKPSKINKIYFAIGIASFLFGMVITNKADYFIADHVFSYQSPIVLQSPVVISSKQLVSPVVEIATPSAVATATPSAISTASPKGYSLY